MQASVEFTSACPASAVVMQNRTASYPALPGSVPLHRELGAKSDGGSSAQPEGQGAVRGGERRIAPGCGVNPSAMEALRNVGWSGRVPRGLDGLDREPWDFVITVCDRAKEACPVFPGQPILAHWGMPDPAAVEGDESVKRAAFVDALTLISRRIDLLLALRPEKLERLVLTARVRAIAP